MYHQLIILLFLFGIFPVYASKLQPHLGNLCETVGKYQSDNKGSLSYCQFNPLIGGSYIFDQYEFSLSYQHLKNLPDQNISRMSLFWQLNYRYTINEKWPILIGGVGLYTLKVSGKGGTVTLNNGNSTGTFIVPDNTVYSNNFTYDAALEMPITPEINTRLTFSFLNLFDSNKRSINLFWWISKDFACLIF